MWYILFVNLLVSRNILEHIPMSVFFKLHNSDFFFPFNGGQRLYQNLLENMCGLENHHFIFIKQNKTKYRFVLQPTECNTATQNLTGW